MSGGRRPGERRVQQASCGGIGVALAAFELEPGQWSRVVSATYDFRVFRVVRRIYTGNPSQLFLELAIVPFTFLPDDFSRETAEVHYPDHRMTIVEPEWRGIVPEWIQYEMLVHDRAPDGAGDA